MRLLLSGQGIQNLPGLGLAAPVRKPEVEVQGLGFQHHGQIEHLNGGLQVGLVNVCKGALKGAQLGFANIGGKNAVLPVTIGLNIGF